MIDFIDSHSHIYLPEFSEDIDDCITRAVEKGVSKIILPNIDSQTILPLNNLLKKYPKNCFGLMGLHPTYVKENYKAQLKIILNEIDSGNYVGVGEVGIDLYWDKTFIKEQTIAFVEQVKYALEKDLPVVIHARDSFNEVFDALNSIGTNRFSGIFHAFTGNIEQARQAVDMGLFIGVGGIVTFKNAGLSEVLTHINIEHLVLETDSPYLTPTPYRGKRNESSYIPIIAQKIADIKEVSIEEVARVTTRNAQRLFKLF
jgi:TatD DNase family protein